MTKAELNAVARATGEDVETIEQRGFSIVGTFPDDAFGRAGLFNFRNQTHLIGLRASGQRGQKVFGAGSLFGSSSNFVQRSSGFGVGDFANFVGNDLI